MKPGVGTKLINIAVQFLNNPPKKPQSSAQKKWPIPVKRRWICTEYIPLRAR